MALEPLVELNRTRLELVLKVLDVDGAVRRVKGGWVATGQPWTYDADRYGRLDAARQAEQQAMLEYERTDECRMTFLRRQLDDPGLADAGNCGRCDNCAGPKYTAEVSETTLADTRQRLQRPGIDLAPRKQWPTGMAKLGISLSGKISDGPEPGRVLGRLSDLGWGQRLRGLLDGPDAPVPDAIVDACIKVLAAWDWAERPGAVMSLESPTHPVLMRSLTARLAEVGRLDDLGVLHTRAPRFRRYPQPIPRIAWRDSTGFGTHRICRDSTVRCCSSTASPTRAGRSRWRRAPCGGQAPPPSFLSHSPPPSDTCVTRVTYTVSPA